MERSPYQMWGGRPQTFLAIGAVTVAAILTACDKENTVSGRGADRGKAENSPARAEAPPDRIRQSGSPLDFAESYDSVPASATAVAGVAEFNANQDGSSRGRDVGFAIPDDDQLFDGEPTYAELERRAAQVTYEAQRRLQSMTDKYGLSEEQQALVFPVLARASKAYHRALDIEGESQTDTYLAELGFDVPGAEMSLADEPRFAMYDWIDPQLALFLDEDQLALMTKDAIDRYYWWGEILLQISSDIDAETEDSEPERTSEAVPEETSGSGPFEDAESSPHQGGNLFDLLNLPY